MSAYRRWSFVGLGGKGTLTMNLSIAPALLHGSPPLADFITDMYGPKFLLFYAMVAAVVLVISWMTTRWMDCTSALGPPEVPLRPDPFEIAFLRGGENEVLRLAILRLMQDGLLIVTEKKRIGQAVDKSRRNALAPMEQQVFDCFSSPRSPEQIFNSTELNRIARSICAPFRPRLEEQMLLASEGAGGPNWLLTAVSCTLIGGLGAYKLMAALAKGKHNVFFLIIMGLMAVGTCIYICRPQRITRRGRAYLRRLLDRFEPMVSRSSGSSPATDDQILLLVSVIGFQTLTGTPYSSLKTLFHQAASGDGGYVGGCGGGGCGGGGCGGGGCGGCGGS